MTTDEILERHGIAPDDYTLIGYNQKWYEQGVFAEIINSRWAHHRYGYAFVIDNNQPLLNAMMMQGAKIIAYYPDPGAYLVKRIAPEPNAELAAKTQARFNCAGAWTGAWLHGIEAYLSRILGG
jgi:hypothetical protein